MRELGIVLQQALGIAAGIGFVMLGGYLLWLILTNTIKNPSWRHLFWGIGMIIFVLMVLRFVAPKQATALYQEGRDWWIDVPSRDIGILFNNLGTALGAGSDSTDYRPLEELQRTPDQGSLAPLQEGAPGGVHRPSSMLPNTGLSGQMVGGAALATCSDHDCPGGQCPKGCRASYTWIHGMTRFGRVCNATEPNQLSAWARVEVTHPIWQNAAPCPSIR